MLRREGTGHAKRATADVPESARNGRVTWAIYLFGNGAMQRTGRGAVAMPDVWWPVVGKLVAAPERRTTRSLLAAELWPDKDELAARRCLATAFWRIKSRLPDGLSPLLVKGESVSLALGGRMWIDVLAFERRARAALDDPATLAHPVTRARLRRALALYRGDLLRERDSDSLAIERERLRALFLDASYEPAAAEARAENWPAARGVAQRLCMAEPLREDAQRLLMTAHMHCGGRALAIRQYHQLTALLFNELGVAPMPATIALAERIGARRGLAPTDPLAPVALGATALASALQRVRGDLIDLIAVVDHALADRL